jgi:hypothetical protein
MEQVSQSVFGQLAARILNGSARKATKFLSARQVVKATIRGGKIDKRDRRVEILFTVGRPNYEERQFIKVAEAAGEAFPVKRVQIKLPKYAKRSR